MSDVPKPEPEPREPYVPEPWEDEVWVDEDGNYVPPPPDPNEDLGELDDDEIERLLADDPEETEWAPPTPS